eukprot:Lithocolla_globosa_v1_NODE_397_length_4183_cov_17.938227.p1 type:complete len:706 gc:universal NODE_397_length_4183_cov_17.938227:4151-2034(-)
MGKDDKEEEVELQEAKGRQIPKGEGPENGGPLKNRHCTDVIWLILFILFWIGMIIIGAFAWNIGAPLRLLYGVDSDGNLCGDTNVDTGNDFTNQTYLLYFDPLNITASYAKCVSECPSIIVDWRVPFIDLQYDPAIYAECKYGIQPTTSEEVAELAEVGLCMNPIVEHSDYLGRCFPIFNQDLIDAANDTLTGEFVVEAQDALIAELNSYGFSFFLWRDLYEQRNWIVASAVMSFVFSWCWLMLLQICAGLMVWTTIFLVVIACTAGAFYGWWSFSQINNGSYIPGPDVEFTPGPDVSDAYELATGVTTFNDFASKFRGTELNYYFLLTCTIVMSIFAIILFLAIVFLRKRIFLAVDVIKVAARALHSMPLIIFYPLFKFIALGLLSFWTIWIIVNIVTANDTDTLQVNNPFFNDSDTSYTLDSSNSTFTISPSQVTIVTENLLDYLQLYYIFGFFWTWNFLLAIGDCSIAGCFATWYWTRNKRRDLPKFIVFPALYRTLRYHMGSLIFGSFILAVIQFIRYLLTKTQKKLEETAENSFTKFLFCCLQCCFWCLEKFISFLNKNAYIEIAIYGYSFCKAAKEAFELLLANIVRVAVVNQVTKFLIFCGILVITCSSTYMGWYLIITYSEDASFWVVPVCACFVFSFGVAYVYMAILEMGVMTIFLSFCEDAERNDGSPEKPYYMVKQLQSHVDKDVARAGSRFDL